MPIDYSKLTDAELDALLAQDQKDPYESMTDEELDAELNKSEAPQSPAPTEIEDPSYLDSASRGVAQGASLGFIDELSGRAGQLAGALGLAPDMGYEYYRDYARQKDKESAAANPKTFGGGQLAGGVASAAIPGLGAANSFKGAAMTGAALGGASGVGSSEADLISGQTLRDALIGGTIGGVAGGAGQKLGTYLTGSKDAVSKLNTLADDLAEKATGATAVQAERFAPGAGKILREEKLVRFGDSPANIAERVANAERASGAGIGNALSELDSQGVNISRLNVIKELQAKADELSQFDGTSAVVKKLNKEIKTLSKDLLDKVYSPVSKGEIAKRNFQKATNYHSPEASKTSTGIAANAFKNEVERAAMEANPALAEAFMKDKQLFSVLRPVKEAAERRATQLNQSPFGGVGDMMSIASGGPKVALARRIFAPRLSSSASATAGATADSLAVINRILGKSADPISDLIQLGVRTEGVNKKQSPWMGMTKKENKK